VAPQSSSNTLGSVTPPHLTSFLQQHQVAQQHAASIAQKNVAVVQAATAVKQQQQQQQPKSQNFAAAAQAAAAQMSMSAVVAQQASLSVQRAVQGGSIHKWKIEEIESHIQLLRDAGRPIPNQLQLVLEEARRREHKKTAKRVANRKSACTSRARKKALVEEMTKANARLKRQAQILSLLPDLVIATTVDARVTFCAAQVENVLRLKVEDLMDAQFSDLIMPRSQGTFSKLVAKLVAASGPASDNDISSDGRTADSNESSEAAVVSEQSFPPAVVNTATSNKNICRSSSSISGGSTNSNNQTPEQSSMCTASTSKLKFSSLSTTSEKQHDSDNSENIRASEALNRNVHSHNAFRRAAMAAGNEHTDDVLGAAVTANNADARLSSLQHVPRRSTHACDGGGCGASASEKNACGENKTSDATADTNMVEDNKKKTLSAGAIDSSNNVRPLETPNVEDTSSASSDSLLQGVEDKQVQRNEAGVDNSEETGSQSPPTRNHRRRRSRLTERVGHSSDDSGYKEGSESIPSPEDVTSSDDSLSEGRRARRYAPACRLCIIRGDLSTVWCEVTSSIRTRCLSTEASEAISPFDKPTPKGKVQPQQIVSGYPPLPAPCATDPPGEKVVMKELLLCLRPLKEGKQTAPEKLRFKPGVKRTAEDNLEILQDIKVSLPYSMDAGNRNSTESQGNKKRCEKKARIDTTEVKPASSSIPPPSAGVTVTSGTVSTRPLVNSSSVTPGTPSISTLGTLSASTSSTPSRSTSPGNNASVGQPTKKGSVGVLGVTNNSSLKKKVKSRQGLSDNSIDQPSSSSRFSSSSVPTDTEKSVVESLMLMSNKLS